MRQSLRIFFSCSGVGIIDRGIEVFFREAFDQLLGTDGLDITLYKGAGEEKSNERVLWNVPRTDRMARLLGACIRRNSYVAEQLSTFPSMVRAIRGHRPVRWRKQIGVPFRLLFSNGGPCHPPFDRTDYVHQVAPFYIKEALDAGESPDRHRMVPYGINVPDGPPDRGENIRRELRRKLGLPEDRPIILSVRSGWITLSVKSRDSFQKSGINQFLISLCLARWTQKARRLSRSPDKDSATGISPRDQYRTIK